VPVSLFGESAPALICSHHDFETNLLCVLSLVRPLTTGGSISFSLFLNEDAADLAASLF